jgi:hypothetical protein
MLRFTTIALFLVLGACVPAEPTEPSFIRSLSQTMPTMTYDQCKQAQVCTISGQLGVVESDGVAMGELALASGGCVTLSLSQNDLKYVRRSGGIAATASGKVYRGHHDSNSVRLEIEGRKVGYPRCGDFYVFVR